MGRGWGRERALTALQPPALSCAAAVEAARTAWLREPTRPPERAVLPGCRVPCTMQVGTGAPYVHSLLPG